MKRREFLRLGGFVSMSVATMAMTGCDISADNSNTSTTSSDDGNAYPNPVRPMPAAATGASWWFPQSIASGDPRDDSIILWTRVLDLALADATADANASVAVNLRVTAADNSASLDSNAALTGTLVADVMVPAYTDFDGTVRHKLAGLAAGSVYFFQFTAGDVRSKVGRFKTAPAASAADPVDFAFMSCQDWSENHWGAFADIVNNDATPADPYLDFVVHLGDYIYETDNAGVTGAQAGHGVISFPDGTALPLVSSAKYATTLADYRYLYKLYRSDARIQRVHERFPMVAIWDDHEFSDDAWQNSETYTNVNQPQFSRRRSANQAWFEFMPADVTFQELNPSFQNIKLYRDLQFGSVLHLVMTDERLYRQDHLIPENTLNPSTGAELGRINSRYLAPEGSMKLAEGIKDASAPDLGLITMLGATQRDWWKTKMQSSPATWKVWGNEVSLLRMGLNGTNALATLIPLGAISSLATNIVTTSGLTGGSIPPAAAIVGAVVFGASNAQAGAAANAIAVSDGGGGSDSAKVAAAMGAGLSVTQATVAVAGFNAAKAAALAGANSSTQATAAAQTISIGFGKPDILANKADSVFFNFMMAASDAAAGLPAGTTKAKVSPFFQKFVLNADQWDGYGKERANLMNFLLDNGIQNVVAVTGDIHAFFAGSVYNEYASEVLTVDGSGKELTASAGGTAAMVDLVTAGVSSTSWFNYIKTAADALDPTNSLIGKLVYAPVPVAAPGNAFYAGSPAISFTVYLNLLDYTMGKVLAGADDAARKATLAAQLNQQLKKKLGEAGFVEPAIDASAAGIQANIAASASFAAAYALAMQLSALGVATNPWLAAGHVDTEAQGYALVSASAGNLVCRFKKLNPLVGVNAPAAARTVTKTTTATVTAGIAAVVIS